MFKEKGVNIEQNVLNNIKSGGRLRVNAYDVNAVDGVIAPVKLGRSACGN